MTQGVAYLARNLNFKSIPPAQGEQQTGSDEQELANRRGGCSAVCPLGRKLHPNSGQIIDIEEAAVVDVVRCHSEVRGAPELFLDQRVETGPPLQVADLTTEALDRPLNRRGNLGVTLSQSRQLLL
jgi:hypothetical protein